MESTGTQLSADELASYARAAEPFWTRSLRHDADGYGHIRTASHFCWDAVPNWGRDGRGLGTWPHIVIFHRLRFKRFELAEYFDGAVRVWAFPSRELRGAATDRLAHYHWAPELVDENGHHV